MSIIKITTLTPVHIGSGETLQYGNDFVMGKLDDGSDVIGIVDARKVMECIGQEHINNWVAAIERKESTDKIVKQFSPKSSIEDYSKRIILRRANIRGTDTLKVLLHDGLGRPYIPGSSIKGAIRTAILATIAPQHSQLEYKIKDFKGKISAKEVEKEIFGRDPNSDIFRFVEVGDAYFGDNYEVAIRMVNINERKVEGFWDTDKQQLIEALCDEDKSTFQMKLNMKQYEITLSQGKVNPMPPFMQTIPEMFETINNHTLSLVKKDIEYWKEREPQDSSGKVTSYLEKMAKIKGSILECSAGKSCVLRIGHGSGWNFITGAWSKSFSNFDEIVNASRPKNSKYTDYAFPKTRRVDDACGLLGFVKLTLEKL